MMPRAPMIGTSTHHNRWVALDYWRGLMALAVMAFHFDKWTTGVWDGSTAQGKLGVYAVSIFFMLSGMALTETYQKKLQPHWQSLFSYVLRRVFRIFPLLWAATGLTLLLDEIRRSHRDILLNLSGLFGFIDPSKDIATGAWSIGCELVFYALFPILVLMHRKKRWFIHACVILMAFIGMTRAFGGPFAIQGESQSLWWSYYVQVPNHAFFFVTGMSLAIHRNWLQQVPRRIWWFLLIGGAAVFLWVPVGVNPVGLVRGWPRMALSALAVLVTTAWSFGIGTLQDIPHKLLAWLGSISYSIYLLHPLVYRATKACFTRFSDFPPNLLLPIACAATLLAGHAVYYFFEKPIMLALRPINRANAWTPTGQQ